MSTESQRLLLHAYLDDALDVASAVAVRAEIEGNRSLSAELACSRALQRTLRARFPHEPLSPAMRRRIDAALPPRRARRTQPTWRALAASVLVAVALSGGVTWSVMDRIDAQHAAGSPLGAAVDSHMRALMAAQPFEVASAQRHIIKPWFNGRIAQAPRVIDLGAQGFPLIGARIDVIDRAPVPTLVYARRLHKISVTAITGAATSSTAARPADQRAFNGFNVVSWNDGKAAYVATSDLNREELSEFAQLFRSAAD